MGLEVIALPTVRSRSRSLLTRLHIETASAAGDGSAKYLIPPPIVPQLGRLPTAHASATATKYLNVLDIALTNLLRYAGWMA
jgi:hypothetical protein